MINNGSILGDYIVADYVGEGHFGKVFRATHNTEKQSIAVKVCLSNVAQDDINRFKRENEILHRLKEHPRVITPLSDILQLEDELYYFMELADCNLEIYLIQDYEGLTFKDKVDLFKKICEGVKYVHSKNIVHRDLWWKNILLKRGTEHSKSEPKINDFGRAKNFEINITAYAPQNVWGINLIIPPELNFKYLKEADKENYALGDMYALGIVLFYILQVEPTGYAIQLADSIRKFLIKNGVDLSALKEDERLQKYNEWSVLPEVSTILKQLSVITPTDKATNENINHIIQKLANPNFSLRYQSIEELIGDLNLI